jgi:hypothetical protein
MTVISSDKPAQDFSKPHKRYICYMLKGCTTEILVLFSGTLPIEELYEVLDKDDDFKDKRPTHAYSIQDYKTFFDDSTYTYLHPWVEYLKNQNFNNEKKREMVGVLLDSLLQAYRDGNKMEIFGGYNYTRYSLVFFFY